MHSLVSYPPGSYAEPGTSILRTVLLNLRVIMLHAKQILPFKQPTTYNLTLTILATALTSGHQMVSVHRTLESLILVSTLETDRSALSTEA